ncbi:MAG: DUF3108 domain-containing protein [Cellvibrionaceae bacterium]
MDGKKNSTMSKIDNNTPVIVQTLATIVTLWFCLYGVNASAKPEEFPYFTATYDANIKGLSAQATREFKPVNATLSELNFKATSWLATLNESAQFLWEDQLIQPIRFNYSRKIMGKESEKVLTFDPQNKKIISTYKDKTYTLPNKDEALDYLSFQLQLQYDLLKYDQLKEKKSNVYRIADKDRIKEYRFEIMGDELVETELGNLNTIKVKVIRENKNRATYLWLAKEWHHLLVRLEQHKNEKKEFEIQLTSATVDGRKVAGQ